MKHSWVQTVNTYCRNKYICINWKIFTTFFQLYVTVCKVGVVWKFCKVSSYFMCMLFRQHSILDKKSKTKFNQFHWGTCFYSLFSGSPSYLAHKPCQKYGTRKPTWEAPSIWGMETSGRDSSYLLPRRSSHRGGKTECSVWAVTGSFEEGIESKCFTGHVCALNSRFSFFFCRTLWRVIYI